MRLPGCQTSKEAYEPTLSHRSASHPVYVRWYNGLQADYTFLPTGYGLPSAEHIRQAFAIDSDLPMTAAESHWYLRNISNVEFRINRNVSVPSMREFVPPIRNDRSMFTFLVEPFENGNDPINTFQSIFGFVRLRIIGSLLPSLLEKPHSGCKRRPLSAFDPSLRPTEVDLYQSSSCRKSKVRTRAREILELLK